MTLRNGPHPGFRGLLLLSLLLGVSSGYSQPNLRDEAYIDSISTLLPGLPVNQAKAEQLLMLAGMHIPSEMEKALDYAGEALIISEKTGFTEGVIRALGSAAFCHAIMGDWPQATIEVNRVLRLSTGKYRLYQIFM